MSMVASTAYLGDTPLRISTPLAAKNAVTNGFDKPLSILKFKLAGRIFIERSFTWWKNLKDKHCVVSEYNLCPRFPSAFLGKV